MRKEWEWVVRGGPGMEATTNARQRGSGGMQMETTLRDLQSSLCLGTDNAKQTSLLHTRHQDFLPAPAHPGRVRF